MLFVVRGHLQSSQVLRDGLKSCCMLGPGNFSGDELLSWCLCRPFIECLPPSSSTLVTLKTTEAFGLEAEDVKYVTQHFRSPFGVTFGDGLLEVGDDLSFGNVYLVKMN
ncbi:hypothetical protein TIFTF001_049958 [Ficus carica]|uniref:Cyclic nucleotide-binding domain-containing protein n=2 Tax=Ficus carica TaxID=3494 RepID=A0AA87YPD9_FICCA|nr:hypothetical protein TIFTF001_049958 [Ficus carica]